MTEHPAQLAPPRIADASPSHDRRPRPLTTYDVWRAEPLSPRLRALVALAARDSDRLARRVCALIESNVPGYAGAAQTDLRADVLRTAEDNVDAWYEGLLSGTSPLSPDRLATLTDVARRRRRQGISLGDVMRAYRLGPQQYWLALIEAVGDDAELQQELLQKISLNLVCYIDIYAQTLFAAYVAEERQYARSRDRLHRELSSLLFTHPDDGPGFRELGGALGLDVDMPASAFSFRLRDARGVALNVEESLDRFATEIGCALGVSADGFLRALRGGHLLIWRSVPPGQMSFEYDRKLAYQAATILRATTDFVAAGIGLPGSGPHGWRVAAEQATRALEMQIDSKLAASEPHGVSRYSQLALIDGATASENTRRFFESITDRLAQEPNLLETLQTYFELKQQRKRVAAALNVHPNTLDHRLTRIEALLDLSLNDVAWLARLQVALQLWARGVEKTPR
jgi:sugar diacid utilization regulator